MPQIRWSIIIWAPLLLATTVVAASAAEPADPEWPCIQRKVPELTVGQMWSGPIPQGEAADPDALARVVRQIAQRRVTIEEAAAAAASFVEDAQGEDRARQLGLLFEAVLERINRERGAIIGGIGRYARRQAALAERVEQEQRELARLESPADADGDAGRVELLRETLAWDTRIFRERAQSLTYVCETPVLLERRAFDLARALAGLI